MSQPIELHVPDIGDMKDVPIIDVVVQVGARIEVDETVIVVETDKATVDVPSTAAGVVKQILVQCGDRVSCGTAILLLESPGGQGRSFGPEQPVEAAQANVAEEAGVASMGRQAAPAPGSAQSSSAVGTLSPATHSGRLPYASPSIRRFARELGVDLNLLRGSGPKDRILRSDILDFLRNAIAASAAPKHSQAGSYALDLIAWPQVDFAKFGPVERTPLSKIRKITGANLSRNSILIPHVTNFDEADVTGLEEFRVKLNEERKTQDRKLTMLAFLIKASVTALQIHPVFNASLDGEELVLKRYFHIGFAADTPNGLVVPVIRDADSKGLTAIAAEAGELAQQARTGKIKPSDMQGGCFTISSLGGIGGSGFTPIVNAPEVAILGAARARMMPVWDGAAFAPRLILPLSLSWDHRVVDGAEAARFLVTFTSLLADFRRVSL